MYLFLFCFFFFQAEDGIRDRTVTGVQTCALPIFSVGAWSSVAPTRADSNGFQFSAAGDFGAWVGFRQTLGILNTSGSDFALAIGRSEEHTSELQSPYDLVCRPLLEKKKNNRKSKR